MFYTELPWQGSLLQSEEPSVSYLVERPITKDFGQWFVVSDHQQIFAALSEVAGLLQAPGHC